MKKFISIITLICLITTAVTGVSGAAVYTDISGHWAEAAINAWSEKNIINGYNGLFRPDDSITRGETAVILDRIMKFPAEAANTFSDLDSDFYTSAMLKANHAGVILGSGGLIRPNDAITLQETVVMMCRAFGIEDGGNGATKFLDDADVADWARGSVNAMARAGYIQGANGYLNPKADITRAQVITILDNMYKAGQKILTEKPDGAVPAPSASPEPASTPTPAPSVTPGGTVPAGGGGGGGGGGAQAQYDNSFPPPTPTPTPTPPPENSGITITTSLTGGEIQKGSKKTFDVWATDKRGDKIPSAATLNGVPVPVAWDDNEKTSFTLDFTVEGENTVAVTATDFEGRSESVTYKIIYEKERLGTVIGESIWCVEIFALGRGYLIAPQKLDIMEGENCAQMLGRLIKQAGFDYENTGTLTSNFYLSFIKDGQSPMDLQPDIPQSLAQLAERDMDRYDPNDFTPGRLGEFDFSNGSGWMYCVNDIFPNIGFSENYLTHGDVVRVQYSLAYGMDNGGFGAAGNNGGFGTGGIDGGGMYFDNPGRDFITAKIAEIGLTNCDPHALELAVKIDASFAEINTALGLLY